MGKVSGNEKGFTLLELLVVITIIAVISTVVLLMANVARRNSRDDRRLQDIKNLTRAIELYIDQYNGVYPSDNDGIDAVARWSVFNAQLRSAGVIALEGQDPLPSRTYDYADNPAYTPGGDCPIDPGRVAWVLAARLETDSHPAFLVDSDCEFTGTAPDCRDTAGAPWFCLLGY